MKRTFFVGRLGETVINHAIPTGKQQALCGKVSGKITRIENEAVVCRMCQTKANAYSFSKEQPNETI